ncbi:unnamed protein product [Arctia plantaginis]|uniref:Uncharacterized protein n=1 Tax=Arctia plantaginis TaxID=874455 RepID=A0A8S0ZQU9_ARCPL|nr:unnamed protein product [Arctia plantaginis]CAB3250429.1 unnamed protein product [Arctia plantaginis]
MFGPLLRRSILQGSASRTWNYLINFTHLLWCKLKYIRELRMPRTRRKHYTSHSRSRSRSYEAKRRRLDDGSTEGSYRKRSRSRERDRLVLIYYLIFVLVKD